LGMEAVSLAFGAPALQTPQFVDCSAESMRNAGVSYQVLVCRRQLAPQREGEGKERA
jgi:hypothetical protein